MNVTIAMGPWLPIPALRGGAMPKVWHGLAQELARRGHHVSILARSFEGQPTEEHADGIRFVRSPGFSQGRSLAWNLVKDLVYAIKLTPRLPPADILVTNDFWTPFFAARFARRAGRVVVCAARHPKGQYRLYKRVSQIVAISESVRRAIVDEQPALGHCCVSIPLPIDTDAIATATRAESQPKRTLLYAGRVHPEKGIELLLRAFARVATRFPNWRLKIVGPVAESDGGGGEHFERKLRALGRGVDVEFGGALFDVARLANEYRNADLFCYPSLAERGEAFGVAAVEAMAAGVPPIVSSLECFGDFVRHRENGWVFDHRGRDAESSLAGALTLAMSDDAERKQFGERARSDAARFTYAAVASRYLDEFDRILAKGSGNAAH